MALQMNIDFTPKAAQGKRTERLTVTCSSEFKAIVDLIGRMTGETVSEMGHRYFIQGIQGDLGRRFMAEPHLDKSLRSLMG